MNFWLIDTSLLTSVAFHKVDSWIIWWNCLWFQDSIWITKRPFSTSFMDLYCCFCSINYNSDDYESYGIDKIRINFWVSSMCECDNRNSSLELGRRSVPLRLCLLEVFLSCFRIEIQCFNVLQLEVSRVFLCSLPWNFSSSSHRIHKENFCPFLTFFTLLPLCSYRKHPKSRW